MSVQEGNSYREEQLSREMNSKEEHAEELITTLTAALEAKDAEAVKEMFSPYVLEHAENMDEKIEELIDFYPGCKGGYKTNIPSHRSKNRGVIEYVIYPKFTITNDNEVYKLKITAYIENDVEPEKLGVYNIQVMTKEAEPKRKPARSPVKEKSQSRQQNKR